MDPYRVLGVDQNATDDDIKTAYRNLVKKYHPDRFQHDSAQQAAAAEELKKINAAYDLITKMRQGQYETGGTQQFAEVRAAIQRGAISDAEYLLRQIGTKNAEWHYLMGIVMLRRGWYESAAEHFSMAYRMEPGNSEYERAMRAMANSAGMYANFGDEEIPRGRGWLPYSMCCCLSSAMCSLCNPYCPGVLCCI